MQLYFGCGPLTVTVTTKIITFLIGNPYKPSFTTVTVRGPHPNYIIIFIIGQWLWIPPLVIDLHQLLAPLKLGRTHESSRETSVGLGRHVLGGGICRGQLLKCPALCEKKAWFWLFRFQVNPLEIFESTTLVRTLRRCKKKSEHDERIDGWIHEDASGPILAIW